MKYKDIKVLYINPVVYLGQNYMKNDWKQNEQIFKTKIENLDFGATFDYECPIEDMISINVHYEDKLEPIAKESTINKIFNVINELLKVFNNDVKVNLYLENFIDGIGNSVDLEITEFLVWLKVEIYRHESVLIKEDYE